MNQAFRFRSQFRQQLFSLVAMLTLSLGAINGRGELFTVTRTNATGPGSLPAILGQANSSPGNNVIEFAVEGTVTLNAVLPPITNSVAITCPTGKNVVISGGDLVSIFAFGPGTTNSLRHVTLAHGSTTGDGGAIRNEGTLDVDDCSFAYNMALTGSGGAIHNSGTLTLRNTLLSSNTAAVSGGALFNAGSAIVADCSIGNNVAGTGGSFYNSGVLVVDALAISSNTATYGLGGALFNVANAVITSSTFSANQALGEAGARGDDARNNGGVGAGGGGGGGGGAGLGGALYSDAGTVSLTNCTLSGNLAGGGAGGQGGTRSMLLGDGNGGTGGRGGKGGNLLGGAGGFGARLSTNATSGTGGGFAGGGGGGGGGNGSATQEIHYGAEGTFGGWSGGKGGAGGHGGNIAGGPWFRNMEDGSGGSGGEGHGGAIFVHDGSVALVNCTIANNTVSPGLLGTGNQSGQPGIASGGGVYRYGGIISLSSTVIAENSAPNGSPDVAGAFLSSGYNLVGNSQGASGLSVNDYQDEKVNLGPLQDNGGPTFTHALLDGSLAVGGANPNGAPVMDQRGVSRPADHPDIGAYQTVPGVTSKPPRLTLRSVDGASDLTIEGVPGALYRLESRTNLAAGTWSKVTDLLIPSSPFNYKDSNSGSSPARYYRLAVP